MNSGKTQIHRHCPLLLLLGLLVITSFGNKNNREKTSDFDVKQEPVVSDQNTYPSESEEKKFRHEEKVDLDRGVQVIPVEPEKLMAVLPESLGEFSRDSLEGKWIEVGPVRMAQIDGKYHRSTTETIHLGLVDVGKLVLVGRILPDVIPPGMRIEEEGTIKRGVKIGELHGMVTEVSTSHEVTLRVRLNTRMMLTLKGMHVSSEDLIAAAKSIDFGRLATLTGEAKK